MSKSKKSRGSLEVGKVVGSTEVFIAVSPDGYAFARKPLSHEKMHVIRISQDDLDWLIAALKKERVRK